MKGRILVAVLTVAALFFASSLLCASDRFQEERDAAFRCVLEKDSFDWYEGADQRSSAGDDLLLRKGEIREEEGEACVTSSLAEGGLSVMLSGGAYDRSAPFDDPAVASSLAEKAVEGGEPPDYSAFVFHGSRTPMTASLSDGEIAYLFARIVSTYTVAVPIKGRLERIVFLRESDELLVCALITVSFEELTEKHRLSPLPDSASFSLRVPFTVQGEEILAKSDEIELRCETFYLPETLLVYGCNAAFGWKDYRTLFGKALENVLVNAGIFR